MAKVDTWVEAKRLTIFGDVAGKPVTGQAKIVPKSEAKRRASVADVTGVVADPRLYGRTLRFQSGISCLLVRPRDMDASAFSGGVLSLSIMHLSRTLYEVRFTEEDQRIEGEVLKMTDDRSKEIADDNNDLPKGFISLEQYINRANQRKERGKKLRSEVSAVLKEKGLA